MKKLTVNMDAGIVVVLVFVVSFSMNFFQRYQYADLLRSHNALQVDVLGMEYSNSFTRAALKKCNRNNDTAAPVTGGGP